MSERQNMGKQLLRFPQIPVLLFWICAVGSMPLEAQGPQDQKNVEEIPDIKVDVSLVTMDVTVIPLFAATCSKISFENPRNFQDS